jgi:DNA-binding transcriptional LysR family regulator
VAARRRAGVRSDVQTAERALGKRRAKLGRISDLDLRLLRVFQAVAEAKGLAAAELRLGISRSTISTHLSSIESRLGARLCERGRGGFKLTEDGVIVYRATVELMRSLGSFQEEIESLSNMARTTIRVALLDSLIWQDDLHLNSGLNNFARSYSNVNMELFVFHPSEIERRILDGSIDVAFSMVYETSSEFECEPIFSCDSYLYCGSESRLFKIKDENISESDLRNTAYSSKWFNNAPALLGQRISVAQVETFHIEATAHMILSGCYVGFLPANYAKLWVAQGRMRAVRPDLYKLPYTYGFIYRKGRQLPAAARAFIECLRDSARTSTTPLAATAAS